MARDSPIDYLEKMLNQSSSNSPDIKQIAGPDSSSSMTQDPVTSDAKWKFIPGAFNSIDKSTARNKVSTLKGGGLISYLDLGDEGKLTVTLKSSDCTFDGEDSFESFFSMEVRRPDHNVLQVVLPKSDMAETVTSHYDRHAEKRHIFPLPKVLDMFNKHRRLFGVLSEAFLAHIPDLVQHELKYLRLERMRIFINTYVDIRCYHLYLLAYARIHDPSGKGKLLAPSKDRQKAGKLHSVTMNEDGRSLYIVIADTKQLIHQYSNIASLSDLEELHWRFIFGRDDDVLHPDKGLIY